MKFALNIKNRAAFSPLYWYFSKSRKWTKISHLFSLWCFWAWVLISNILHYLNLIWKIKKKIKWCLSCESLILKQKERCVCGGRGGAEGERSREGRGGREKGNETDRNSQNNISLWGSSELRNKTELFLMKQKAIIFKIKLYSWANINLSVFNR